MDVLANRRVALKLVEVICIVSCERFHNNKILDSTDPYPLQILKQYLDEALKMLKNIKSTYSTFQNSMMKEARKLPSSLEADLEYYESAICQHLGVMKQMKPSQSVSACTKCHYKCIT